MFVTSKSLTGVQILFSR